MLKKVLLTTFSLLFLVGCSSCSLPFQYQEDTSFQYPIHSFVQILTFLDNNHISSGSGAVIRQSEEGTLVLTAYHICMNPRLQLIAVMEDAELTILPHGYEAEVVAGDAMLDICLMKVPKGLSDKEPLRIAQEPPTMGEEMYTVSSPISIADVHDNLVGMFRGPYLGKATMTDGRNRDAFAIPTAQGASGSAIFNENHEIVSVTTHIRSGFENYCIGPEWETLYDFITEELGEEFHDLD